jgi:hypothetical protein
MRQSLKEFGYNLSKVPLLCDNESATRMTDNPIDHGRVKHIDIRYHFLRDQSQRGYIIIDHVSTHKQLTNIFTKPLNENIFCELRSELNILDSQNMDWNVAHIACLIYLWPIIYISIGTNSYFTILYQDLNCELVSSGLTSPSALIHRHSLLVCTYLGGVMLYTKPLRPTFFQVYVTLSLKLKGK